MRKKEKIFLTVLIFSTLFLWLGSRFISQDEQNEIKITVNGDVFGIYSLSEDQTIPIGDTNILELKNGEAKMIHAACPDHLCMKQNPITAKGGTIVCLPNKVIIEGGRSASSGSILPAPDAVN